MNPPKNLAHPDHTHSAEKLRVDLIDLTSSQSAGWSARARHSRAGVEIPLEALAR